MTIRHELWLWLWFGVGAMAYVIKRAFYLITGPNPVANNVSQFVKVAGVPIGFRLLVDSGIYWLLFTPQTAVALLKYMGWQETAGVLSDVTHYAVFALFFGLGVDPLVDWAIPTIVGRIPFFKDWWPQMPAPLPRTIAVSSDVTNVPKT